VVADLKALGYVESDLVGDVLLGVFHLHHPLAARVVGVVRLGGLQAGAGSSTTTTRSAASRRGWAAGVLAHGD